MTEQPPGLPPQQPPPATPLDPVPAPPVAPAAPPVAPAPPVAQPAAQPAPGAAAPQYGYVPAAGRPGPMPGVYFASHPARLIAWIIDGIILSVIAWLIMIVVGIVTGLVASTGSEGGTAISALVGLIAILAFTLVWYPYWWSKSGQSPGKKLMHLKVVRAENGALLSFGGGFLRLIGYWVSGFVFYIGFLWILVDGKRQGWADKIAGTYVIEVP